MIFTSVNGMASSSFGGTLPPDLNILNNLTLVDLHNNSLTGPLPYFSGLFALQTVYLGHNNFTLIPDRCFRVVPMIHTLNLSNNLNLVQDLFPKDLINSPNMHTLDLEATNIIGSLPSDLFTWFPSLHTIVLSHNNISGTLPSTCLDCRYVCIDQTLILLYT